MKFIELIKKNYENIFTKIIAIYILGILLILTVIIAGNIESNKIEKKNTDYTDYNSLSFHAKTMQNDIYNIVDVQNMLLADSDVLKYMNIYNKSSKYDQYIMEKQVKSTLTKYITMNRMIRDIKLYSTIDDTEISYNKIGGVDYLHKGNHNIGIKKGQRDLVCIIQLNEKYIKEICNSISLGFHNSQVAMRLKDNFIYKTDNFIYDEKLEGLLVDSEQSNTFIEGDNYYLFSYMIHDDIDLIVKLAPAKKSFVTSYLFYVSIMVLIIISIIFIAYIYYIVKRPMMELTRLMKKVEDGNLDIEVRYDKDNQFKYIFSSFKNMLDSLNEYIKINYKQQREIDKSEINQLQSQINPHFLYNCFFNISNLCKIDDSYTAGLFSQRLATYYMYITRKNNNEVTLEEEYKNARDYLNIQQMRFRNRMKIYMMDLPEDCKDLIVSKIILQPIIENSFKHTFDHIDEGGEIKISIRFENNTLNISIQDNGTIITDKEIKYLNKTINRNDYCENTGIRNVHKRLYLRNNNDGILLKRGELGGLETIITINYSKGE